MSIKKSLLRNLGASTWGKISLILVRLMEVPLLLLYIGVDDYGRWLIISSLPSWLSMANFGFGSVGSSEMTMAVAAGNMHKGRSVFSTAFALVIGIGIAGIVLTALLVPFVPWENILLVPEARRKELAYAAFWLTVSVFISFSSELFEGRLRAAHKAHLGILVLSFHPWISLLLLFIVLSFSTRFDIIAFTSFCAILIQVLMLKWLSHKAIPELDFSLQGVKKKWFKVLFRKGVAFQAFPLGNALLFQGNLLVVQAVLGPGAVALFGTTRTLVRSINQVLTLIYHSIWPELSYLFGAKDMVRLARLHRVSVGMSILIACVGVFFLAIIGPFMYEMWVGQTIKLPHYLLLLFLLPIPFNALWFTSSAIHSACNQHEGLAKRYLLASALSLLFCVWLSYEWGIGGAALSTLVAELVLIPYVFRRSLKLTEDTWSAFIPGIFKEATSIISLGRKLMYLMGFRRKVKQEI